MKLTDAQKRVLTKWLNTNGSLEGLMQLIEADDKTLVSLIKGLAQEQSEQVAQKNADEEVYLAAIAEVLE
jgi:hypothetical protein